ncbi:hypothetical protein I316_07723 [Kwoniella heveanensis BCC8398]|uniref:Uncharacterized protein n=1 Tax=Kwoniella heveanensis BCC8398 TaxID=1296120 RepID=A0A1B9GHX4_9TREE|nr:hypothetical protein I316_07723 [Kwoniella heveanensis BCC8398]
MPIRELASRVTTHLSRRRAPSTSNNDSSATLAVSDSGQGGPETVTQPASNTPCNVKKTSTSAQTPEALGEEDPVLSAEVVRELTASVYADVKALDDALYSIHDRPLRYSQNFQTASKNLEAARNWTSQTSQAPTQVSRLRYRFRQSYSFLKEAERQIQFVQDSGFNSLFLGKYLSHKHVGDCQDDFTRRLGSARDDALGKPSGDSGTAGVAHDDAGDLAAAGNAPSGPGVIPENTPTVSSYVEGQVDTTTRTGDHRSHDSDRPPGYVDSVVSGLDNSVSQLSRIQEAYAKQGTGNSSPPPPGCLLSHAQSTLSDLMQSTDDRFRKAKAYTKVADLLSDFSQIGPMHPSFDDACQTLITELDALENGLNASTDTEREPQTESRAAAAQQRSAPDVARPLI